MTIAASPLISIVTPSLNQGKFVDRTMSSVLDQSYLNVEYIVIDGGSHDASVDTIKKYQDRLKYWVSEKDRGQTEAINKGLQRMTGDIWAYLCSDDTYEPETFAHVVQAFKESDADVVYGNCNFINAEGVVTRRKKPGPFDRERLLRGNYIYQPSVFLKRWILDEFGLFDEQLHYSMDYEYWLRISTRARFLYIDKTLSNYRLHANSKSMKAIQGMNDEGRALKHKFGVGFAADVDYYRFKFVGASMYRLRRWLFETLSKFSR